METILIKEKDASYVKAASMLAVYALNGFVHATPEVIAELEKELAQLSTIEPSPLIKKAQNFVKLVIKVCETQNHNAHFLAIKRQQELAHMLMNTKEVR